MHVHVKVLGALNKPFGKDDLLYEVAEGSNLETLLLELGYHRTHLRLILPAINGTQAKLGDTLKAGDEILLGLLASGG